MFGKLSKWKIEEMRETLIVSQKLLGLIWKSDRKIFIAHIIAISIPAIIPFVNAYIYKLLIDLIIAGIGHKFDFHTLYTLLAIRFGVLLFQYSAFSFQNYMELLIWTKLPIHLYQLILSKLTSLDVEYFENSRFRDNLQRVRESYAWMPLNMYGNLFYTYQSILQLTIAFLALASLNFALSVGIIIAALPTFINQLYYSKTLWGVWSENSPFRKRFWYLSDLIQNKEGIKEMKIFGTAKRFLAELTGIQKKFAKQNLNVGKKRLRNSFLLNIFGTFIYILIEGFIAVITIAGKISLGSLTYYIFVVNNFETGVSGFFGNLSRVFDQSLYVKDILNVLDMPAKIKIASKPVVINTNMPPKIEFKNVSFSYPESKEKVLDNFSIVIQPGEKVAFVGENGAGKTTIIKLLARFYDVNEGEILINGINIKEIDLVSWYKSLGVIFQDFIKYEYSLEENIHFGKLHEPFNLKNILNAAAFSGVDRIARDLPNGYKQMLGKTFEDGVDLSHGQWQKVALARTFLRDAPILILDEPTASIDAKAEKEIFDKVDKLSKSKTAIVISHRFSTVRNADKIYVIEHGKIVESGTHKTLLAKQGIYAALFKIQAERYK